MKRMRKGIVVLVIAATGAIGVVGTGAAAQASTTPIPKPAAVKVVVRVGDPVQRMGSSWQ